MTCQKCDESEAKLHARFTIIESGEMRDIAPLCFPCAREMGFDVGLEPGVCRSCNAQLPDAYTICEGCAKDLGYDES